MQISLNGGKLLGEGGRWSSPTVCTFQQAHKYPGQGEEIAKEKTESFRIVSFKTGYKALQKDLPLLSYRAIVVDEIPCR